LAGAAASTVLAALDFTNVGKANSGALTAVPDQEWKFRDFNQKMVDGGSTMTQVTKIMVI
jgi:hypothetical protein